MAVYANYEFYTEQFQGTAIAQADFDRLARDASIQVDQLTFGRAAPIIEADVDPNAITAIQNATCAVAEELQKLEAAGGVVASESVGRHSVTYAFPHGRTGRIRDAAKPWLWQSNLMYRGFNADE